MGNILYLFYFLGAENTHIHVHKHTDIEYLAHSRDVRHCKYYFTGSEEPREIKWVIQDDTLVREVEFEPSSDSALASIAKFHTPRWKDRTSHASFPPPYTCPAGTCLLAHVRKPNTHHWPPSRYSICGYCITALTSKLSIFQKQPCMELLYTRIVL